jgi:flagellar M-ring protein FliF
MEFSWPGIKTSVKVFWDKLSRPQKMITVLGPLLVAGLLVALIIWSSRPQYAAIFTKLSDSDAGAITTKLKDLKADYKLADNGTTILVPQQTSADIRLQLASAGLPQESKFSFDSLNTMHLGETDSDRKLRYVLGLQNELENTLKTLNGVQEARVHIVMPEPSLFVDSQKAATAAVTVKLLPGTKLGDDQVRAIANLLAGSVEGLESANVTIVDTGGNVLSDVLRKIDDPKRLTVTQYQLQQTVEEDTRKSVQSMLDKVFKNETIVRINAVLDFDQRKMTKQTYGPGAIVSEQSATKNTTNGSAVGGTPGLTSNGAPTYPTAIPGVSTSTEVSNTVNNQVDTTQEEQVVSPGAVKRLSVSVVADSDYITQNQLDQIKTIVASAAGIDLARGDQIQVAALPFNKTELEQEKQAILSAQRREMVINYSEIAGVVLLVLLILIVLILRSLEKVRAKRMAKLNDSRPMTLSEDDEEMNMKLAQQKMRTEEEHRKLKNKEAIEKYAQNNPAEVARLVRTWLSEGS